MTAAAPPSQPAWPVLLKSRLPVGGRKAPRATTSITREGRDCSWAKAQALRSVSAAYPSLLDPRDSGGQPSGRPGRSFWSLREPGRRRRGYRFDPVVSNKPASTRLLLLAVSGAPKHWDQPRSSPNARLTKWPARSRECPCSIGSPAGRGCWLPSARPANSTSRPLPLDRRSGSRPRWPLRGRDCSTTASVADADPDFRIVAGIRESRHASGAGSALLQRCLGVRCQTRVRRNNPRSSGCMNPLSKVKPNSWHLSTFAKHTSLLEGISAASTRRLRCTSRAVMATAATLLLFRSGSQRVAG
jgi:hypothetical protein